MSDFPAVDLTRDGREVVTPNQHTGKGNQPRKHDPEWLTEKQRRFVELVADFEGTLMECARVAGYEKPASAVNHCYRNPYIMRAILRRYHRRMLAFKRAWQPMPKVAWDTVDQGKRNLYLRATGAEAKALRAMQQAAAAEPSGDADAVLGRKP